MNTTNNKKSSDKTITQIEESFAENPCADFPEIDLEVLKEVPGGANQTRAGRGRGAARG